MSDPEPMARLGGVTSDGDDPDERPALLRAVTRVRAPIVLVPLVVGLLAAASIGAGKLWADLPERSAVSPDVTCWNNTQAPIEDCPQPRGRAGLRWAFPSFDPGDARCAQPDRPARKQARPVEFACELRFDQRPVTITYTARTSLRQGLAFIERTSGAEPEPEADGERLVFRPTRGDDNGRFLVTVAYADYPFSVTVIAPSRELRDTALAELVDFRPADRMLTRS